MANKVTTIVHSLRTSGLQMGENRTYFIQTFGVAKNVTDNYCSTVDLKTSFDMQALKEPPVEYDGSGPFKSVTYQSRSIITDGGELEFTGNEQYSAVYCDSMEVLDADCDENIIL